MSTQVLSVGNFSDLTNTHNPNVKSTVARYTIPQGKAFVVLQSHSLEFMIPSRHTVAMVNDSTETQEVTLPFPFAYAESPLPFSRRFRWQALDTSGDVVLTASESEITVSGLKVTGPKPKDEDGSIRIDFLPRSGTLFLDQVETRGTNRAENTMFEDSLVVLHTGDQYHAGSVPRTPRSHIVLEDMHIEVAVNTPWTPVLDSPLARISIRYQLEEMRDILEKARRDSQNPGLTVAQLRAGYVQSWG